MSQIPTAHLGYLFEVAEGDEYVQLAGEPYPFRALVEDEFNARMKLGELLTEHRELAPFLFPKHSTVTTNQ